MAHKVCIDGTTYEIDGGKAMVDGTVYEIDHGTANVDGTAYEVGFGKPVTITLKRKSGMYNNPEKPHGWIVVNGQTYYAEETPTEIPVKTGTTITCCVTEGVQVNGQYVSQGAGDYEYTVSSNAIIEIVSTHVSDTQYLGLILITEIPEGHAEVSIGGAFRYAWVTVNGISHTAQTVVLPIGTVIECTLDADDEATGTPNVVLNGATVKTGTGTYMYTVTKNASVYCYTSGKAGVIHITEN